MPTQSAEPSRRIYIFRHPAFVRVTHWINVVCVVVLVMSGLQIFNAHPQLDWGKDSNFERAEVLSISDESAPDGRQVGVTQIFGGRFDTTGVLGVSQSDGETHARAFPSWATIPGSQHLAAGRRWHFFFAWILFLNGLIYIAISLAGGHARRDLAPSAEEIRHVPRSFLDHLLLRFPKGEDAKRYNVLQKLSYVLVVFAVFPLLITAGLMMSPALNAAFPWLLDLFGGRQSARTIHFLAAAAVVAFVIVHVVMVFLSGPFNNIRSMITGRYEIEEAPKHAE